MEDVRALTLRGIRRMAQFVALVYLVLAAIQDLAVGTVEAFAARVRTLGEDPADLRCRIFRGAANLLGRLERWRRKRWRDGA